MFTLSSGKLRNFHLAGYIFNNARKQKKTVMTFTKALTNLKYRRLHTAKYVGLGPVSGLKGNWCSRLARSLGNLLETAGQNSPTTPGE